MASRLHSPHLPMHYLAYSQRTPPRADALIVRLVAVASLAVLIPGRVKAEDPDKSSYTLFDPVPDDLMRKFAPDRPTKGFSVRTIDAGHIEIETDIVNDSASN